MKNVRILALMAFLAFSCNVGTDPNDPPEVKDTVVKTVTVLTVPVNEKVFDVEVYFFDVPSLGSIQPPYTGVPTYTGEAWVADYGLARLSGPYRGSSFPNSSKTDGTKTIYNTIIDGPFFFNTRSGHKGGTRWGLNVVLETGLPAWTGRKNLGFDPNGDTLLMELVNIHIGASDRGNYNSRGSQGCLTMLPADGPQFFANFGLDSTRIRGDLDGGLYVFRVGESEEKDQILERLRLELQ